METKIRNSPTTSNNPRPRKTRATAPSYTAQEKAQAILAVWTEVLKSAEVCRQMKVNWITFQQWQDRAMYAITMPEWRGGRGGAHAAAAPAEAAEGVSTFDAFSKPVSDAATTTTVQVTSD